MVKLQVIGHLGRDCVVNNVNGKNVINFSVAHTESYKDNNGTKMNKTTWVECAYWTDRTGIAPYLKSGAQVFVEGIPDVKTYKNKDGVNVAGLTLRTSSIQLLGSAKESRDVDRSSGNYFQEIGKGNNPSAGQSSYFNQNNQQPDITEPMDDLPF